MSDMRRLGSLFLNFRAECAASGVRRTVSVKDMLDRSLFKSAMVPAIIKATEDNEATKMKAGLKVSLYYLLVKLTKFVKGVHLVARNDDEAAEMDRFRDVLKHHHNSIFGSAIYKIHMNRQIKLRKPEQLPLDTDLEKIRTHTITRMKTLLDDPYIHWTQTEFVELRNLAECRLTLFNARRGGEAARLTISNWNDAKNDVWLRNRTLPADADEELFPGLKLMYHTGKGIGSLVPCLVPADVVPALNKLVEPETRRYCDISQCNLYLFPTVRSVGNHVSGWHAVSEVAKAAGIDRPDLMTATGMRHYMSTKYAALDVPEAQRAIFYKHMGHSAGVNASIYQAPPAEQEVTHVGKILQQVDASTSSQQYVVIVLCVMFLELIS